MVKYINCEEALSELYLLMAEHEDDQFEGKLLHWTGIKAILERLPAADVVERKPLPEDVEELVKDLYEFAKDCTDSDMCKDCQFGFMCEDGWPPNAIAHLIETWSATHKAMTGRKTGKWIGYPECLKYANAYSDDHIVCSACEECFSILDNDCERFNYCPNCGAKMEVEYD